MNKQKSARETFPGKIERLKCCGCGERENLNYLSKQSAPDNFEDSLYCDSCLDYVPEEIEN